MKNYLQTLWSNPNYRKAIMILSLTGLWLSSGLLSSDTNVRGGAVEAEKPKLAVKARNVEAQDFFPQIQVRARTEAARKVNLKSEVSGRVVALPVAEGQLVKQGDTLCELAVEDRALRVEEARSSVAQAQMEYDGALRLKSGGYQSKTAIAAARARLDATKANLKRSEINLANTKITAPFAGMVERHDVEVGDYMDRGQQCAVLLDLNPLLVVGQVSETEVARVKVGQSADASLVSGGDVGAEIKFVGFDSDTITRTFRVEAEVDNADFQLRSGITTDLKIKVADLRAHLIPSSLLSLDDAGKLGVRILDADHRVQFTRVNIVGDDAQGVWVQGLPESALLITVGQEYASNGAVVEAVIENPKPEVMDEMLKEPIQVASDAKLQTGAN